MHLTVRHADGDNCAFRWYGLNETFSEVRDMSGTPQQTAGRDQVAIALKIGTASLVEKFVRFQVPRYHEADRQAMAPLVPGIRSSFRVSSHVCERPRERLDDEWHELVDRVSERRFLPALTMTGHLESPQMHGVAAESEVLERVLVRA